MKIYQLTNITATQMMCYVIKTSDGKTIVIDGGNPGQSSEPERIIDLVGKNVDLWFMTHLHNDHFGAVIELLEKRPDITVGSLWQNEVQFSEELMKSYSQDDYDWAKKWQSFLSKSNITLHDPVCGEKIKVGTAEIEILRVANPKILTNNPNNQSLVFKITENDFSIIFLGDLGIEGGEELLEIQKGNVKADGVQMAHHGQQGVEKDVYAAIDAEYAFWPTPKWLWDNTEYLGGTPGNGPFKTPEVAGWMKELGAKNVFSFEKTAVFDTETKEIQYI